ncbi:MAG: hypothetical protein IJ745_06130 [Bacteroidales bacterium]|nr:hypothetical protein [Bacteroidales bacterium]
MKKYLTITIVTAFLAACSADVTTREFRSVDNTVVAQCQYKGTDSLNAQWQITDGNGNPIVAGCDSLRVVEIGEDGHPATVCFFVGDKEEWRQYFSGMQLRSQGTTLAGLRTGHWIFYFPNGSKQAESDFVDGKEEGPYKVYRENGIPYYIGQYHEGQRTGRWEFYAADGSLAQTQEY